MTLNIVGLVLMGLLGSFGSYFLKRAVSNGLVVMRLLKSGCLYCGVLFYVTSALLSIGLLRRMPYSVVVPAGALSYVWTMIISRFCLGEKITGWKIFGLALIMIGVIMVALSY